MEQVQFPCEQLPSVRVSGIGYEPFQLVVSYQIDQLSVPAKSPTVGAAIEVVTQVSALERIAADYVFDHLRQFSRRGDVARHRALGKALIAAVEPDPL